jgi:hypothetical protein
MEIVGRVDWRDGAVTFFEPRTHIVVLKIRPQGGSGRARGVDVQGDRAMITTVDGRRELWSVASYTYIRDLD